jgi:hypothetical protein
MAPLQRSIPHQQQQQQQQQQQGHLVLAEA